MENKSYQLGVVSWELFNDLYESQYDIIRKIKFFVHTGQGENGDSLALELVEDLLSHKQDELERLRQKGLAERDELASEDNPSHSQLMPADSANDTNIVMSPLGNRTHEKESVWNRFKKYTQKS